MTPVLTFARFAMPPMPDYVSRIRRVGWDGLRDLWRGIDEGSTPGWQPGRAMEYLVLRAFELADAHVRWPFTVEMDDETVEQIDGAVYLSNFTFLLEVKDTASAVEIGVLAKMRSQLARRPASTLELVVSRSGFTGPAITLAGFFAPQTVLLLDGDDLARALRNEDIVSVVTARYRECVERGMPRLPKVRSMG